MALAPDLPDEGELPSLAGATGWLNSQPLTAAGLRGRVVLVNFWTYSCINWIRTLPYVRAWAERYRDRGLVVLGVHTPEFGFETDVDNVRRAAQDMRVGYPIALDSDYAVWEAFDNHYWPALYFVDADGQIRHHWFGEGEYEGSETVTRELLASSGADVSDQELVSVAPQGVEAAADWANLDTQETYVGYARAERFASPGGAVWDERRLHSNPQQLQTNEWALAGEWTVGREAAVLNDRDGEISFRFHARDLNVVMGPSQRAKPVRFRVRIDGEPPGPAHGIDTDDQGGGTVTGPRMYQLVRQPGAVIDRTVEIEFLDPGLDAYVFTFG
jgi:thiol-disulfide isomerase/thioredoxin